MKLHDLGAKMDKITKLHHVISLKLLKSGVFSLVILSKFVFEDNNSVFALIKFAFAPASDDSD